MTTRAPIQAMLSRRLAAPAADWLSAAEEELARGADAERFAMLLSQASRHARRAPLAPDEAESAAAGAALPGWSPERWTLLETVRVALVLARPDLALRGGADAIHEAFRYADEGELCALYRALAHLPGPERFAWRAKEGCRTNMVSVFEANVLDTPLPALLFDDVAWNQAAIKCVFVGAPLWRLHGLDARLSPELARMALDLADERRSAGRPVQHELWLCLGAHGGQRGIASLERELDPDNTGPLGRRAAGLALVRAGAGDRLRARLSGEKDRETASTWRAAIAGGAPQTAFRALDPRLH